MVGPRVLIIDDNPTHQRLASLLCQKFGAVPIAVERADDAIRELERAPSYAVVLLDLGVPRAIAGRRCLQELLAFREKRNFNLPIVALTAHAMEIDRMDCMRLGTDGYLSKPFTFQQFGDMLSMWTDFGSAERRKAS